ncbi:hypothetical protein HMPREF1979_00060 [Actinomyces johnsonii F0542]|jgi:phosphopantetheine attachment domain protein|uniref:Carrier domain-containing protein n=1 Tax=Actinomyces johnsonii F0542 TaxID=1321818 RepID=U1QVH5_9ACTO|nr:acyl carrier protein [Actinomyces johnsonii]ERH25911.1 hypothetical protein HMPREF1979_00060 [Actinomyces johnsonii F0542]
MPTIDDILDSFVAVSGPSDIPGTAEELRSRQLSELGYDSLAILGCSADLEEKFKIKLDDDLAATCRTLDDMLKAVLNAPKQDSH